MTSASPRPVPDLVAEEEVDLGRHARAILERWWLLLAGLVAGAAIGYLATLGGSQYYRAQAVVYMGQPLGILGTNPVQALNTNPSAARAIVTSDEVVHRVAAKARMSPGRLRSGISVTTIAGNISKVGQAPLILITVKGPEPGKIRTAADGLAAALVSGLRSFANKKIGLFTNQLETDQKAIASVNEALAEPGLSTTDKLLLQLRLQSLQSDATQTSQLLFLANNVEAPSVVTHAVADKTPARNHRNATAVGALIGLILGALAAVLWDPVTRLRRREP
jgi:hypothetical protein